MHCYPTLSVAGLFGEGPVDRRERLRQLMAVLGEDTLKKKKTEEAEQKKLEEVGHIGHIGHISHISVI